MTQRWTFEMYRNKNIRKLTNLLFYIHHVGLGWDINGIINFLLVMAERL